MLRINRWIPAEKYTGIYSDKITSSYIEKDNFKDRVMSWNDLRKGRYSQTNREYFITFTTYKRVPLFKSYQAANCFCRLLAVNEAKLKLVGVLGY